MEAHAYRRIAARVLGAAALLALGFFSIHAWIALTARGNASRAMGRFGGGPVDALIETVKCESCALAERNQAVWALGQLGDARALPALRARYTGAECDHARALCQHEIRKAIRHLETGWGLPAPVRFLARAKARAASP